MFVKDHSIPLPPPDKAPTHTGNIFTWMWYFLYPYRKTVIGFSFYRAFRSTFLCLLPLTTGFVIDGLENGSAFDNPDIYVGVIFGYMTGYFIVMFNMVFVPEIAVFEKAARGLTLYGIKHLNSLSLNWHEQEGSGGKLQRIMTGRRGFQEFTRIIRWDVFPLIGTTLAIFITVVFAKLPLFYLILFFGFVVTYLGGSWYFARPYLGLYDKFNEKFEKLLSGVYEFVSSIRTVKSFHLSEYIEGKASNLEEVGQHAIMKTFSTNLKRWTICNMISGFWLAVFVGAGFYWVMQEKISIGDYSATILLAIYIWSACEVIGSLLEKFYEYGNGIDRMVQTLRVSPKRLDIAPIQPMNPDWQTIEFDRLSFTYPNSDDHGVKNIDFKLKRGEKIAFVGESGAGKSTLVKLLMKQMLADDGALKIDGSDLKHIETGSWLSQIGFVPQDVELFNLSIRDNIVIDRDDIDDETYKNALKQSALYEFVEGLPEKSETVIGERGIKLSGGQRQRLGIARALVRRAPIIVFDEATSSLDSLSEKKIQEAMNNAFAGNTVFLIAHRLSTVRHVDTILVLDKGQIVERGSFEELTEKDGPFARLWKIQSTLEKESA